MKIKNDTEERIVMEPGESIDVFGSVDSDKVMASRRKKVNISGVKEGGK